jgi:hypothetical protein
MVEEFELASQKIHNLITLNETISSVYQFDFDEDKLGLLNKLYLVEVSRRFRAVTQWEAVN